MAPEGSPHPVISGIGISVPPPTGVPPSGAEVKLHSPHAPPPALAALKPSKLVPYNVCHARTTKVGVEPGGKPETVTVCWRGVKMKAALFGCVPMRPVANGTVPFWVNRPTVTPPGKRPAPDVVLPAR